MFIQQFYLRMFNIISCCKSNTVQNDFVKILFLTTEIFLILNKMFLILVNIFITLKLISYYYN